MIEIGDRCRLVAAQVIDLLERPDARLTRGKLQMTKDDDAVVTSVRMKCKHPMVEVRMADGRSGWVPISLLMFQE